MTDAQIVAAVRDGTHVLVPHGERQWHVGYAGEVPPEMVGVFVELKPDKYECEEQIGVMMGGMTKYAPPPASDIEWADDRPF